MMRRVGTSLLALSITFLTSLSFVWPANASSVLTDENLGGLGGVYHAEAQDMSVEAKQHFRKRLVEILFVPVAGQEYDLCFMFREKRLEDHEWEYGKGWVCSTLKVFPNSSVGCQKYRYCFTSQQETSEQFYKFNSDYNRAELVLWKTEGDEPLAFRLYRKQDESYVSWMKEPWLKKTFIKSSMQSAPVGAGSGFVINKKFVVTADHVLRDPHSGKQCRKVGVYLQSDEKWVRANIHAVNPLLDLAILELSEPATHPARLGADSIFSVGESVAQYGLVDWDRLESGMSLSAGEITRVVPHGNKWIASNMHAIKGDSGSAVLDTTGDVIGVLLRANDGVSLFQKSTVLEGFLKANRISYKTAQSTEFLNSEEMIQRVKPFTTLVACQFRAIISSDLRDDMGRK